MGSSTSRNRRPYGKTLFWGIFSAGLYTALYFNEGIVTQYFARGGLYAFLPIAAAFVISFVHGHFTGHFWTSLGVEASKRTEVK